MDFEYDYEEREKDGMVLEIDGLKIEIPEELVQKRMTSMHFFNKEEVKEDILLIANMLKNEYPNMMDLKVQLLQYLEDEVFIYGSL